MRFDIVKPKEQKLRYLERNYLINWLLFQGFIIIFLIAPLVPKSISNLVLLLEGIIVCSFIILIIIASFKYDIIKDSDYDIIGQLIVFPEYIVVSLNGKEKKTLTSDSVIELYYDYVRGEVRSQHDIIHRGISCIKINQSSFQILIKTHIQRKAFSKIIKHWYKNNISFFEFSLGTTVHLYQLEPITDYKKQMEIKKQHTTRPKT